MREARAAARLSHPNVVAVYDQGDDDGTRLPRDGAGRGHTLRDTIAKEAPMSPERALALLEPVLSALAAAHRAGLIHRDVKPENVLIADDGRIKVADFGLAKAVSADTQHTATGGVLIGTVSYLAPELVVDGRADARADVYAAGVVLYELLTGVKPHEGESPIQVAYKHVHEDVPPPSERLPRRPPYVDALVARATARDRAPAPGRRRRAAAPGAPGRAGAGRRRPRRPRADLGPRPDAHLGGRARHHRPRRPPEVVDTHDPRSTWHPGLEPLREHTTTYPAGVTAAPPPAPPVSAPPVPVPAPARRPRRRKRGAVLLVLALVAALALGGGAFWFGYARYTTTPTVVGLTQADAEEELDGAGLEVEYADPIYATDVPQGQVVTADPGGGSRILPGETVTLTLSLGKLLVPEAAGPHRGRRPGRAGRPAARVRREHRALLGDRAGGHRARQPPGRRHRARQRRHASTSS